MSEVLDRDGSVVEPEDLSEYVKFLEEELQARDASQRFLMSLTVGTLLLSILSLSITAMMVFYYRPH